MNPNAWKQIPTGTICLDFSDCTTTEDWHNEIKSKFGFPEYYGENWDALWDLLEDFAISEGARTVLIVGQEKLSKDIKDYMMEGIAVFRDIEKKYPNIHFIIENRERP